MTQIDSHLLYQTISHEHLDDLVDWALGDYPDSGLVLVECKDGRWFVEQEYGHAFDSFSGISKPKSTPYLEPTFYPSRNDALERALVLITQVYPSINKTKILEYFEQE